jgi:dipeptidyl aminopeptidase/acylaminoacyl peptidase
VTFSPDSGSVAFVPGSAELVRLSLADQQRAVVARNVDLGTTIAWGESGIYFLRGGELWLAAAEGGGERRLTRLDRGRDEVIHTDVVELPGLRRSLFTSLTTNVDGRRIESVAHDGGARTVVVERASTPTLAPSGHLLFERDGAVWGAPFDARRAAVTGPAVLLLPAGEVHALPYGSLGFRLSTNGTLVYMPPDYDERRVVSVTREGVEQALELPPGVLANPRVSPDGRRLLVERGMSVVEALELTRGTRTQLAAAAFASAFSTWTADGERVVFRRFGVPAWVAADGSGRLGRMPHGGLTDFPSAPGPDADSVLTVRIQAQTAADIFLTSVSGAFAPRALLATPAYEGGPQLSPDSRWLAYQSNASGQPEVYVRPYPALDRAWQVSEAGGVQTRWSPDGREIYYRTGERMMAASFDGGGGEPLLGRPEPLFADEFDFGQGLSIANYDVTREGRFLMLRSTPSGGRLRVVLHWNEELERLLGTGGLR